MNILEYILLLNHVFGGFPGGAVVENPPANAGDGFEPWSGKIPHAAERLGPGATVAEAARLELVL